MKCTTIKKIKSQSYTTVCGCFCCFFINHQIHSSSAILHTTKKFACNCLSIPWFRVNRKEHYSDVTMSAMASQISIISTVFSTVWPGSHHGKHQSPASLAFVRGTTVADGFPSQRVSDAENIPIWWRHHGLWHLENLGTMNNRVIAFISGT